MRRKFILVGLLMAVFVLPHVLTIEESAAAGLGCPPSLSSGARIQCLQNKARELLALNRGQQQRSEAIERTLHICEEDLHRYDEKWDARQAERAAEEHINEIPGNCGDTGLHDTPGHDTASRLGLSGIAGIRSPARNEQPLNKIKANAHNINVLLTSLDTMFHDKFQMAKDVKYNRVWLNYQRDLREAINHMKDNVATIAACTNGYPSGC